MSSVNIKRTINAPINKVYDALVNPDQLKNWFAPEGMTAPIVEMPSEEGGAYRVCMKDDQGNQYCTAGRVIVMDKPNKISMTWKWEEAPDAVETTLTISLTETEGEKTEVSLVHEGFSSQKDAGEHEKGWESCLNKLEKLFS